MLEHDEDFYRKWLAVCASTDVMPLSLKVTGNLVSIHHGQRRLTEMSAAMFYRLSTREILNHMGVPTNERQRIT